MTDTPSSASSRSPVPLPAASGGICCGSHSPFPVTWSVVIGWQEQRPTTSLAGSTSDPEGPSPIYTGGCHFGLAIILGQGGTILWKAAVTLLNIALRCD